jgi:hypothetical protein
LLNKSLRASWLAVTVLLACVSYSSASSQDALARISDRDFSEIKTVSALPGEVKAAMAELFKQKTLTVADPSQRFNSSDVVNSQPTRRLIFSGCSKERCVVHYEKGGRGHTYHAMVLKLGEGQRAEFLWAATYLNAAHDLQQLKSQPHTKSSSF